MFLESKHSASTNLVQIWCKVRAGSPAWTLIKKVLLIYAFPWQMAHNNSFKKTYFGMPFASNECVPIASFKICGYRTISVTSGEILACQDSGSKMNKKKKNWRTRQAHWTLQTFFSLRARNRSWEAFTVTNKSQCFNSHRQSWEYKYCIWPNTSG